MVHIHIQNTCKPIPQKRRNVHDGCCVNNGQRYGCAMGNFLHLLTHRLYGRPYSGLSGIVMILHEHKYNDIRPGFRTPCLPTETPSLTGLTSLSHQPSFTQLKKKCKKKCKKNRRLQVPELIDRVLFLGYFVE